ncbi:hypothetical protein M1446_05840 [Candidatus Dependentiae bacterium]|nr:hypothetical protein [Candidatus Dependentiae bacterium]
MLKKILFLIAFSVSANIIAGGEENYEIINTNKAYISKPTLCEIMEFLDSISPIDTIPFSQKLPLLQDLTPEEISKIIETHLKAGLAKIKNK